jgi:hypothetical protein
MSKLFDAQRPAHPSFRLLVPALDLIDSDKPLAALALLAAVPLAEPRETTEDWHLWFQVSISKLRCYNKMTDVSNAKIIADQIVLVEPPMVIAMQELWTSGFVVALIQYMRLVNRFNFIADPALQVYRDFIETNGAFDEHTRGVVIYQAYKLGLAAAVEIRKTAIAAGPFEALRAHLTPATVTLLAAGHYDLLHYTAAVFRRYADLVTPRGTEFVDLADTLAAIPRT